MKFSKIYFFIESTFNQRDYHRFGIDVFRQHNYSVYIIDFTPLFRTNYLLYTPPDQVSDNNLISISKKKDAVQLIESLPADCLVISIFFPNRTNLFIFELLKEYKISYCHFISGLIPASFIKSDSSFIPSLISAFKNPVHFLKLALSKFFAKSNSKDFYPNYLIYGGILAKDYYRFKKGPNTKLVKAHSFDYDRYLEEEKMTNKAPFDFPYAVFLDEFVPYHPDYLINQSKPDCESEIYYLSLNKFFEQFENYFNLKIIIAAHPRASYNDNTNPFKGREIIYGNTISLVKFADLVLAHSSTAISFAVIYSKPVNFLTYEKYSPSFQEIIDLTAKALGKEPFELSSSQFQFSKNNYNFKKEKYNSYLKSYIKEENTPEKISWEIFIDNMKK